MNTNFHKIPKSLTSGDLGLPYLDGTNTLILMAVGPHRVHVFWQVNELNTRELQDRYPVNSKDCIFSLQFYAIESEDSFAHTHPPVFEQRIDMGDNKCYVNLPDSGKKYIAILGYQTAEDTFLPVASSNLAELPSDKPASPVNIVSRPNTDSLKNPSAQTESLPSEHTVKFINNDTPPASPTLLNSDPPSVITECHSIFAIKILQENKRMEFHSTPASNHPLFSRHLIADDSSWGVDGITSHFDLTEICEQKFISGISSS